MVQVFSNSGPRVPSSVFSSFPLVSGIQPLVSGSLGSWPPYPFLTSSSPGIQPAPAFVASPQLVYPGFPPVVWGLPPVSVPSTVGSVTGPLPPSRSFFLVLPGAFQSTSF